VGGFLVTWCLTFLGLGVGAGIGIGLGLIAGFGLEAGVDSAGSFGAGLTGDDLTDLTFSVFMALCSLTLAVINVLSLS